MNEQEIYRLVKTKERAIAENLLLPGELQSLKEAIMGFLDQKPADGSLLSLRYRKLKVDFGSQTLWTNEKGYPADGPGFIRPWIAILEQYLGDKAVKKRLEDKDLWVESSVQGRDEHLFIGGKRGSAEKVHIVVDGETGEIRIDPKDQAPHDLLERVEVILTTKGGKRIRSTRAALEFLDESTESMPRPAAGAMDAPTRPPAVSPLAELRRRYARFLSRLTLEWASERDSNPMDIEEGKAIMARARQDIIDFLTDLATFPGTQDAVGLLEQIVSAMTVLQRHRLSVEAETSKDFWDKGDQIIADLEQARRVIGPSYIP